MTPLERVQAETMATVARWLRALINLGGIEKRMDKWDLATLNASANALDPDTNPRLSKKRRKA